MDPYQDEYPNEYETRPFPTMLISADGRPSGLHTVDISNANFRALLHDRDRVVSQLALAHERIKWLEFLVKRRQRCQQYGAYTAE